MPEALTLSQQIEISRNALLFFSSRENSRMREMLDLPAGVARIEPFSVGQYLQYLNKIREWPNPWNYTFEIARCLKILAREGFLVWAGQTDSPLIGDAYYMMEGLSEGQATGNLWLTPVLGPQLVVHEVGPALVHLLGRNNAGDVHGGTGLLVSSQHVLTAKHVLEQMSIDRVQTMEQPGLPPCEITIKEDSRHDSHDLAVLTVEADGAVPAPINGLEMRQPVWADPVTLMGYPIVPRLSEVPVTAQVGEVVNPSVRTYSGEHLFLYSATARPGNSGGPIIGADGRLIGLVTDELYEKSSHEDVPAPPPFYAGLPTSSINEALADLGFGGLVRSMAV